MTTLLNEAFEKASALPQDAQDVLAKEVLAEIDWENRWDATLAASQPLLDNLTENAMREYHEGRTEEKGIDQL